MGRGEGSSGARAGWACALVLGWLAAAGADVDTSTGLGDNTLTNSGMSSRHSRRRAPPRAGGRHVR